MLSVSGKFRAVAAGAGTSEPSSRAAFAICVLLILALQFGPGVGLTGFRLTGGVAWTLHGLARDVSVALLVLIALWRLACAPLPIWPRCALWALALVLVASALALLSSSPLVLVALNLRRVVLMPLLFLAVLVIPWTRPQIERLFALLVASSLTVALLGVAERVAPDSLWTDLLEIERFTAASALDRFGALGFHESGRFFSWDLERWTGMPVRRMLSSYTEPTTLAAAMALLVSLALARQVRGHTAWGILLLALFCGLATISKGFVLFVGVLAMWRILGVPSPRHVWAVAVAVGLLAAWAEATGDLDGPLEHVGGLATGIAFLIEGNLLGEGLGAVGNYANNDSDLGQESGFGNMAAQLGLTALLPLAWVAALARDVMAASLARQDPGGIWLASWLLFWALTYMLSASSLGVGGNALGFLAMALYLHTASGASR